MPGPSPNDPATRVRGRRAATRAELPAAHTVTAPPLPDPPEGEHWHPLAIEWWNDLWASPQATRFTAMHKHRAYLALHTLNLFYGNPTERLGQRVEVALQGLGVTQADQNRLQWTIPTEQPSTALPSQKKKPQPARRTADPRKRFRVVA